jgi:PAS domain S-box-containing protein
MGAGFRGLNQRAVLSGLLACIGYYLGTKVGLALTFQPHPVSVMWPSNTILLAALLFNPPRVWWFLLLCVFPAHLVTQLQNHIPPTMSVCWFISNSTEALIGAAGIQFFLGSSPRFESMRSIGVLFLCGAFLGPFLSSFLDAAFVSLNHLGQEGYWRVWWMRFWSNVFAALILLPAFATWLSKPFKSVLHRIPPKRLLEAGVAFAGLLTVTMVVFCRLESGPASIAALLYTPLPFLLWIAVRFGPMGTSLAVLAVAFLSIWGAVHGRGPFVSAKAEDNALSIQVFLSVVSTTLMFLATSIVERRQAEERFTKAFRSSPDATFVTRLKDGHIVEMNERCEKLFGFQRAEIIGQSIYDLNIYLSKRDREQIVAGTSAGNGLHDLALRLRTKNGELIHTLVSADTEDIAGEQCLITSIRDVSDRRRAEEAQQNLAHASRLAVVGELTAMIAHEINQPLGAILSNADAAEMLLQSGKPPLEEIREIISDIRKNDLRADEAIRRIRNLLRKREIQMERLDINDTVSDVLRLVAGDAQLRHVQIRRDLTPGLSPVFGDQVHLQQVLLNLIVNGMDAMDDVPETMRLLDVRTGQNADRYVEISVADRGHGIAPEQISQIFELFFTTKRNGMGLGLSIARSIIEAHRGRLWVESNSDGGVTFRFTVPIIEDKVAADFCQRRGLTGG